MNARNRLWPGKARGTILGRPKTVSGQTIARIVELRESGMAWRTVANQLNADKVPTGQGGTWAANTARRLYERNLEKVIPDSRKASK